MKSQKTIPRNRDKKQITTAIAVCIMLLSPLFWRGVGGEVFAQGTGAGNCLSYDGNDYVDMGIASVLDVSANNSDFTISAWIKITGAFSYHDIVSKGQNSGSVYYPYYLLRIMPDGTVQFYLCGTSPDGSAEYYSTKTVNDGTWHHIVGIRSGGNIYVYIDGVQDGTSSITNRNYNTSGYKFAIGANWRDAGYWEYYFNGDIDEVSIWNTALTETEIRANMCKKLTGNESGLVGYWRFDEGSGGTVYDASPNGNNGTLY